MKFEIPQAVTLVSTVEELSQLYHVVTYAISYMDHQPPIKADAERLQKQLASFNVNEMGSR